MKMPIKPMHPNFQHPKKGTDGAAAFDLFMPEAGRTYAAEAVKVPLGFAATVPAGHVAMLMPRSGVGAKLGVELNNTCGLIDPDYAGQWFAFLRTKNDEPFEWDAGARLLQVLIVPVVTPALTLVEDLDATARGDGGFGSTGQ